MSADNAIFIQKRYDGLYVGQHGFMSSDTLPDPYSARPDEVFQTLEQALSQLSQLAEETEYGFQITASVHDMDNPNTLRKHLDNAFRPGRLYKATRNALDSVNDPIEDLLEEKSKSLGNPEETHARIAQVWTGILDHEIQPVEVALMMEGLKLVRAQINPGEADSFVDAQGYSRIAARIAGHAQA